MRWQTSSKSDPRFNMSGEIAGAATTVAKQAAYAAVREKCDELGLQQRPADLILHVLPG
jgi:hypothetical protein